MNVLIVNGFATSGKDTFMAQIKSYGNSYNDKTEIVSIIDYVKEIALSIGWNGEKDEAGRKLLSDLMNILTEYNNSPIKKMYQVIDGCLGTGYHNLCICVRSPEVIETLKNYATSLGIKVFTILIKNDNVEQITSNTADASVLDYSYDITIENNSSLNDFYTAINSFYDTYLAF